MPTVFIGPDMAGPPTVRRDTYWSASIEEAIRYAVEKVPSDRHYGTFIETDAGDRLEWEEISRRYTERSGSN